MSRTRCIRRKLYKRHRHRLLLLPISPFHVHHTLGHINAFGSLARQSKSPNFPSALVNCTSQSCLINLYVVEYLAQQYCNAGYSDAPPGTGGVPVPPTRPLSFPSPPSTPPPPTFPTSITPVQIITGAATPVNGGSDSRGWDGSVERGV